MLEVARSTGDPNAITFYLQDNQPVRIRDGTISSSVMPPRTYFGDAINHKSRNGDEISVNLSMNR